MIELDQFISSVVPYATAYTETKFITVYKEIKYDEGYTYKFSGFEITQHIIA